jgi:class 3 adenylate cyclase
VTCAACHTPLPAGARFCPACGTPVSDAPAAEERKVVTVLFADLVGFTSEAERLDPEDVRAVQAPYAARLRAELERFGGTVEKFIGDAVMALFGAPVSRRGRPERAVRAALAIRDAVADLNEAGPAFELRVRVGREHGRRRWSPSARGPGRATPLASGDVVNTAKRLEQAAPRAVCSSVKRPGGQPATQSSTALLSRSSRRARPSRFRRGRRWRRGPRSAPTCARTAYAARWPCGRGRHAASRARSSPA